MIFDNKIMGSRGFLRGRGASPLPLQGVLKGARSVLERQEAEPPLSFLYASNFDTRKNSNPISILNLPMSLKDVHV